jgi:ubiquinone/menaquinone biosynthesis C-methylase UbiE
MTYVIESKQEAQRLSFQNKMQAYDFTHELLDLKLRPNELVLDIGCAHGEITNFMAQKFPFVDFTGVDFCQDRIESCTELKNSKFLQASAEELPFEDNSFDFIHTRFLLQHLENPRLALKEIKRVLRPTGRIHITETYELFVGLKTNNQKLNNQIKQFSRSIPCNLNIGREITSLLKSIEVVDIEEKIETFRFDDPENRKQEVENNRQRLDQCKSIIFSIFGEFEGKAFIRDYLNACSDLKNNYQFDKHIINAKI